MEIRWLQDFLAVAETGNFTRAAEQRNASQAAFSRRIQQLEAWVGSALIDRSIIPTRLTPAGEHFRETAGKILAEILDARAEMREGAPSRPDHVRIAVPFALATASLPGWWAHWTRDLRLTCEISTGNVHDLAIGLLSGATELMICWTSAQQPVHPEPMRIESIEIDRDRLRPYASPGLIARTGLTLPRQGDRPVPLLMYSRSVYFARLVDLIIETAGGIGKHIRVMETDMSDILRDMAMAGHGIAWLPESTARRCPPGALVPLGDDLWSLPLSIVALKDRKLEKPAVVRLWSVLSGGRQPMPAVSSRPQTGFVRARSGLPHS
jgi:LysR family transcriptional regulator, hypochlorite-specific transcription factor HypT